MASKGSLLFLNLHYWPDLASTGQHLTDLAEYLAEEGYDVRVLCGTARYTGGAVSAPSRETHNGVAIRRLPTPGLGRSNHLGRALDYGAFHVQAGVKTGRISQSELVVSLTTPSLLPVTVACAARLVNVPYGIWAMDLHPGVEERLGAVPAPLLAPLHRASAWAYRGADFVVSLGPAMTDRLRAKGVEAGAISELPVWNREDEVWPVPRDSNPLRRELGIDADTFVVMYSGNAGLAHRFNEVIEAMTRLRDEPDVAFVFVGDGPRRSEIEQAVEKRRIRNFRYLDYFAREELNRSLSLADVHLLTLRADMAGLAAPGKLYGILAAGRPVLMVGPADSDPGIVIRSEQIGEVFVPSDDPKEGGVRLADAILRLKKDDAVRREIGERARTLFERRYTRSVVCARWADLIEEKLAADRF